MCGESDLPPLPGCSGTLNFNCAKDFCENVGARLCTASELAADETAGSGCSADGAFLWSSTSCGTNSYATRKVRGRVTAMTVMTVNDAW